MAHVMDYPEILKAASDGSIIYEEIRTTGIVRPLKFDGTDFVGVKHQCYLMLSECNERECFGYNLHYRCWTEEPSEELMNSTPWKEVPLGGIP